MSDEDKAQIYACEKSENLRSGRRCWTRWCTWRSLLDRWCVRRLVHIKGRKSWTLTSWNPCSSWAYGPPVSASTRSVKEPQSLQICLCKSYRALTIWNIKSSNTHKQWLIDFLHIIQHNSILNFNYCWLSLGWTEQFSSG